MPLYNNSFLHSFGEESMLVIIWRNPPSSRSFLNHRESLKLHSISSSTGHLSTSSSSSLEVAATAEGCFPIGCLRNLKILFVSIQVTYSCWKAVEQNMTSIEVWVLFGFWFSVLPKILSWTFIFRYSFFVKFNAFAQKFGKNPHFLICS